MNVKNDQYGFIKKLSQLKDEQLIEKLNKQVGNKGWGNARANYLEALKKELLKRNFDCDNIITNDVMSLAKKIKLENNRLVTIE